MIFKILCDDRQDPEKEFATEHGLCLYFEADGYKWLFDSGASDTFLINAEKLGINIEDINFLVISHAHSDHIGGLNAFSKINKKAFIFISAQTGRKAYFSFRKKEIKSIGPDYVSIDECAGRIRWIDKSQQLTPSVSIITNITGKYPRPKGNYFLYREGFDSVSCENDNFEHEMALAIKSKTGPILLTGCCHNGLLNILHSASDFLGSSNFKSVIGGTHLIDGTERFPTETDEELKNIATILNKEYKGMMLCTGHCTGEHAAKILSKELSGYFSKFYSGYQVSF